MTRMLSKEILFADRTRGTTGATAVSGAILDTDGYENVLMIGLLESTQAQAKLTANGGTATDAMSEYTGPETGAASGTAPLLYLDINRPKKRYIQANLQASAGGQNLDVITILYGARSVPTSNSTLVFGRQLYSPNSGTATVSGS